MDAEHFPLFGIVPLLVQEQLLSYQTAYASQQQAQIQHLSFLEYIVKHQLLSAQTIALTLSKHFNLEFFDLDSVSLPNLPTQHIDEILVTEYRILPFALDNNHLWVGLDDPSQLEGLKCLHFQTGLNIRSCVVETDKLSHLIDSLREQQFISASIHDDSETSMIKFVDRILAKAVEKKASDVHFEPYDSFYRIRYRQDGILSEITQAPLALAARISARLKVLSHLDITERRLPQDGYFKFENNQQTFNCRVSTCATVYGEKVVLRFVDMQKLKPDLAALELSAPQQQIWVTALDKPQGLILITGPTGSGKTFTLYTALAYLNQQEKNITTIEDPVEMNIPGLNQVNINPKIGLTFAHALRSFLRQDPDVIMLGEIRDLETAEIAVQAAQTGHLVLSTLHTNSAVESLNRLLNMGIAHYNLAGTLKLIVAQRLVRRICRVCQTHNHEGCSYCLKGYRGRIAIFEMLSISPEIEEMILQRQSASIILKQAQQENMLTLYQAGLEKINAGITTLSEINRVVGYA